MVICILKQVYSIGDIGKLISETTKYFELSKAYNRFCANLEISIKNGGIGMILKTGYG